jgi:hypothetical protein
VSRWLVTALRDTGMGSHGIARLLGTKRRVVRDVLAERTSYRTLTPCCSNEEDQLRRLIHAERKATDKEGRRR